MCIKITPNRQELPQIDKTLLTLKIELVGSDIDRNINVMEILREMDQLRKRLTSITDNYSFKEVKA